MFNLNDPNFVSRDGFFLNNQGNLDPLALATLGYLRKVDTTTARFCLLLLIKTVSTPRTQIQVRNNPLVKVRNRRLPNANLYTRKVPIVNMKVRKRDAPIVELSYRKVTTIDTKFRLPASVVTSRRVKPLIEVYINSCD